MNSQINQAFPGTFNAIDQATRRKGFTMPSDPLACSLLRTLAASKPGGRFLELGTGTGLATAWILDGMDERSTLVSVDHDPELLSTARTFLGEDSRLLLVEADGEHWVRENEGQKFDYIFADTWHGKYLLLDEVLTMLDRGGIYIVDDMLPQPNWPDGHADKAEALVETLEQRADLFLTKQEWATGIVVGVKK